MKIIDATNKIAGRIATYVAKQALLGDDIIIINADKAIISGNKKWILQRFQQKRAMGAPLIGPYFPKRSDRILKRIIRGMLPYKQEKGKNAFDKIKCYVGEPSEFKDKIIKDSISTIDKLPNARFMFLKDVSKLIGAKQ